MTTDPNVSDDDLGTTNVSTSQQAARHLENGQRTGVTGAGMMIDPAVMYSKIMEARGTTPPAEAPSIEAFYGEYQRL